MARELDDERARAAELMDDIDVLQGQHSQLMLDATNATSEA